jgi:DNA processing protein
MNELTEEDFYILALTTIEGIGALRAQQLLVRHQSAKNIFQLNQKVLKPSIQGFPDKIIQKILSKDALKDAEDEILFCNKNGIKIISLQNSNYPARLKALEDRPSIIYTKGEIFPQIQKTIAIVGTRRSTDYGHRFLDQFFQELKSVPNILVVSGLAHGIDHRAHSLALEHNIPTIGVMGIALDKIYPTANYNLAKNILKSGGGWMTETSSKDKTSQGVFPRRNRIIAGLADAVLVVETDIKGGSVITAHMANDYGKDVYALPGRISDAQSRGCNDLIQKNLARIIHQPSDIIEEMNWIKKTNKKIPKGIEIDFEGSANQKKILDLIRIHPRIDLERLTLESNLSHSILVEILLELELENYISTLPGNKYELI